MSKSAEQLEKENKELQWELKQALEDNDNYQKQIEVMKNLAVIAKITINGN